MTARAQWQEAFKFALSMVLMYWLALWMDWDLARYGALAIVLISLSTAGASLNKGLMRVIGTAIGCVVGFACLDWFGQERWAMMWALAAYLVYIAYFMQSSRYPYAWFVAGFVPLVIWGDTYMDIDNAFHFGVFRLLETSAGVLIFSVVSVVLWPRFAGDQLSQLGDTFLETYQRLFQRYHQALHEDRESKDAQALRLALDAHLPQIRASLQAAYGDSWAVRGQRRVWARIPLQFQTLIDALELWRISIRDCRGLQPEQALSGLDHALSILEQRFDRIVELWRAGSIPGAAPKRDDAPLRASLAIRLEPNTALSHAERGMLLNFADQLMLVDRVSRELLTTLRVIAGLDSPRSLPRIDSSRRDKEASRWDRPRFFKALIPAVAFIIGYLFWIYPTDPPPGGQLIATQSGTYALLSILAPVNLRHLVLMLVACLFLLVGPIYFVVMPWLDTGTSLLSLIFAYSLIFHYLGYRWPTLKLAALMMFVLTVKISNQQTYSFFALVNSGFVQLMAGTSAIVAAMLLTPRRPEQALLSCIRRFFRNCARIGAEWARSPAARPRRDQAFNHAYAVIAETPGKLRTIEKSLDYRLFPDNPPERVHQLIDTLQSLVSRLRITEQRLERAAHSRSSSAPTANSPLGTDLPRELERLFQRWGKQTQSAPLTENERAAFRQLYESLEQQLETYKTATENQQADPRVLMELTALLGSVRGLLQAMAEADRAIGELNWDQWAEARF